MALSGSKMHFEQVPLDLAKRVLADELEKKRAAECVEEFANCRRRAPLLKDGMLRKPKVIEL